MVHPLILAVFPDAEAAASGTRSVHEMGVTREQISVVTRNHDEAGALAAALDATPGADLEDSRPAAVLGELSGLVLAAIAIVLPGIGPIVAAGPLSAELGESAGHAAGSLAAVLEAAGVPTRRAEELERSVQSGAVVIGVHATTDSVAAIRETLSAAGATGVDTAEWKD